MDNKEYQRQIGLLENLQDQMIATVSRKEYTSVRNTLVALKLQGSAVKAAQIIFNKFVNVSNTLRVDEITRPSAIKMIKDLVKELEIALANQQLIEEIKEPKADGETSDLSLGFNFDNEKVKELLETYDGSKTKLEADLIKNHKVIGYAPVLPLTKPGLMAENLNRVGIKASRVAGYTVLDKQLVVGISLDFLKSEVENYGLLRDSLDSVISLGKKATKTKVADGAYFLAVVKASVAATTMAERFPEDEIAQDFLTKFKKVKIKDMDTANSLLVAIKDLAHHISSQLSEYGPKGLTEADLLESLKDATSQAMGKRLVQLGNVTTAIGAKWLWLAPEKHVDMLNKSAMGGHFKLQAWGLAFSSTKK